MVGILEKESSGYNPTDYEDKEITYNKNFGKKSFSKTFDKSTVYFI